MVPVYIADGNSGVIGIQVAWQGKLPGGDEGAGGLGKGPWSDESKCGTQNAKANGGKWFQTRKS